MLNLRSQRVKEWQNWSHRETQFTASPQRGDKPCARDNGGQYRAGRRRGTGVLFQGWKNSVSHPVWTSTCSWGRRVG